MNIIEFNQKFILENKVLVAPSYSIGKQMLWYITKELGSCINFRVATIQQLAVEHVAKEMIKSNIRLIKSNEAVNILYTLLHTKNEEQNFFTKEQCTMELARELYNTFQELKLHNIHSSSENSPRLKTIFCLLTIYNSYLHDEKLIDPADLLHMTLQLEVKPLDIYFATLSNIELTPTEKLFLDKITNESYQIISMPTPSGSIEIPKQYDGSMHINGSNTYNHPILNTYAQEDIKTDKIHLFRAYGETNEVNYVFQQIIKNNVPFDEVIILYTDQRYIDLIKHGSDLLNIPITLGSGEGVSSTKSYHFVKELCCYIQNRYRIQDLKGLFLDGSIELFMDDDESSDRGNVSAAKLFELLSKLKVGWGLERTIEKIKINIDTISKKLSDLQQNEAKEDETISYFQKNKKNYESLLVFFKDIKKQTATISSHLVSFHEFIKVILYLSEKYIRVKGFNGKTEIIAKDAIISEIKSLLTLPDMELPIENIIERVRTTIDGITINQTTEKAGHIHVDYFESGGFIQRNHIFVIGLDSKSFPVQKKESPIIYDSERLALSPALMVSTDYDLYSKYKLVEILGTSNATITLGYSYFDTKKVRERNPSTFMFQLMDKKSVNINQITEYGFVTKDKDLIPGQLASYVNSQIINNSHEGNYFFRSPKVSKSTNKVNINDYILSASSLERMAQCNRKFYFHDILKIREKEELSFDISNWLPVNEIGILYHKIFERYVKEVLIDKGNQKIECIVEEEFNNMLSITPSPTTELYESELNRALLVCEQFVDNLESDMKNNNGVPIETEKEIEVEITIPGKDNSPSKVFKLRGTIDRVDKLANGKYRIVDYKTGNFSKFKDKKYQIQHYLYKLAYEELEKSRSVVETDYYFPFDEDSISYKGDQILKRKVKKEEIYLPELLSSLINKIEEGSTSPAEDEKSCEYCEYKVICRTQIDEVATND